MPQNPLVPRYGGVNEKLNVTAATVIKATPGTVFRVSVTTAGSAAGSVYDAATTAGDVAANLVASIPDSVGVIDLTWPCATGILVVPGTGQTVSVSYS